MKKFTSSIATTLPEDMLAEILQHAASNSITDFVNIGLSCKAFHGVSNYDDQIFKNVSMKKHSLVPWRKNKIVFQKRCEVAQNVEALYRKGMLDYFSRKNPESGLCCLKNAVEKGHVEAIYVYGIILICLGGKLREQGLQLVSSLGKRSSRIIIGCRSKTKKFLSSMWVRVALSVPKRIDCYCDKDIMESPWEGKNWEASNNLHHGYKSCFWDREAILFCSFCLGRVVI